MKRLIFASVIIVAGVYSQVAHAAAPAECFANSGAAFSAHPNATHASYVVRGKRSSGSGRCWYADAFKAHAGAEPAVRSVPVTARTSPRHAIKTSAPQPRTTAMASAPQLRTSAMEDVPQLRGTVMERLPRPRAGALAPASLQFPEQIPPAVQIAVNARELSRLLLVDEPPTDFNSRFSASGYKAPK